MVPTWCCATWQILARFWLRTVRTPTNLRGSRLEGQAWYAFANHFGTRVRFRGSDRAIVRSAVERGSGREKDRRSIVRQRHVDRRERLRGAGRADETRFPGSSRNLAQGELGNHLLAAPRDRDVDRPQGSGGLGTGRSTPAEGDDYGRDQDRPVFRFARGGER